jgi:hypothetical protein
MNMKSKLSVLWIFVTLNYLYCDVAGLMDRSLLSQYLAGRVNGLDVSQGFLLASGILVEIPIAMVLLSTVLNYRANRVANIVAGSARMHRASWQVSGCMRTRVPLDLGRCSC